jgi:Uncharacterised methyltransferase family (DUF6094)
VRNAGRLKLGHYPLPVEEASNLSQLLLAPAPFFAVDPCAGDGTALLEVTKDFAVQRAAIELDTDRAATAAARGIPTTQGSTFESHLPAGSCSLLYLNPPYDVEVGNHSNQRLELVFLDHCYGWLKTAGVLIFVIPDNALSPCARRLASQFERISIFRLTHPESVRFRQLAVVAIRKKEHHRGDTRYADQLLRLAYNSEQLPTLGPETIERYIVPESTAVPIQYRGLPLDAIEDAICRSRHAECSQPVGTQAGTDRGTPGDSPARRTRWYDKEPCQLFMKSIVRADFSYAATLNIRERSSG